MIISEIRIYSEVLEQGIDFKAYLNKIESIKNVKIKNVYSKKKCSEITAQDSVVSRIRFSKDIDVMLTAIVENQEIPFMIVEYSTAVPTDDHKMQRSDVYYWGAVFKVPVIKICSCDKGMKKSFGGGKKITDELEKYVAYKTGVPLSIISCKCIKNTDVLDLNENSLSCIPYNEELNEKLQISINTFIESNSGSNYFENCFKAYEKELAKTIEIYTKLKPESFIVNSERFSCNDKNITSKINRFGHAMDPDRGVIFFTNMLVGAKNCATEFQVNRSSDINARGGYQSLFDGISREQEMTAYVNKIIASSGNKMTAGDAIYIFTRSLCLEKYIIPVKQENSTYVIKDSELKKYFLESNSMAAKSIFFLSSGIILTDITREIICRITWNVNVAKEYLQVLGDANFNITQLSDLTYKQTGEDIITFASLKLYKMLGFNLIAASFPGAQGDRCILVGQGRKTKRIYVDIIAYSNDINFDVYLHESKHDLHESGDDVVKLNYIKTDNIAKAELNNLFTKIKNITINGNIYTAVAGKAMNNPPILNVDYIMMFDIKSDDKFTVIKWQIAVTNLGLVTTFKQIANSSNKLEGEIKLDKVYLINE